MPGRVHSRRQFAEFARPTHRGSSGPLRIVVVAHPGGDVGVAFAISRKVGNAVVRNLIRRRLRALMDSLDQPLIPGNYLIKCGVETKSLSYDELKNHLQKAIRRCGVS